MGVKKLCRVMGGGSRQQADRVCSEVRVGSKVDESLSRVNVSSNCVKSEEDSFVGLC